MVSEWEPLVWAARWRKCVHCTANSLFLLLLSHFSPCCFLSDIYLASLSPDYSHSYLLCLYQLNVDRYLYFGYIFIKLCHCDMLINSLSQHEGLWRRKNTLQIFFKDPGYLSWYTTLMSKGLLQHLMYTKPFIWDTKLPMKQKTWHSG